MNHPLLFTLAFVAMTGAPALALAQAAPTVGAEVRDAKGKAVGHIERVIMGPGGQPVQVLVRVDRVLRTLPVEALTPHDKDFVSVLNRVEIVALPPSD
jgi:hypothetical protein